MKVAAYCRVSTNSEEQEISYKNQKYYFENIIKERGHEVYKIYADKGLTGTKLDNRPEFIRMLNDAGIDTIETYAGKDRRVKKKHLLLDESDRKPLFDEIWIKNTSRFARNVLSLDIVRKLSNKGVYVYFIEQSLHTSDPKSEFQFSLMQTFDQQDSKDKSSKVSFGKKIGAEKGVISTSSNIYGYKYIKSTNSLEIIPHEADVIRKIYDLYLHNFGIRRIINYLEDNKLFTRQGKVFTPSTIKRILTNEKYAGINVRMKYSSGKVFNKFSYPHINPKDEWIIQENHERIPAIISKETFDKVQETLESKVNRQNQKGIYTGVSEYAGLIYCGNCGDVYHSNCDNGRHFYNCKTKRKKGTKVCNNPNISLDKLNKAIENSSIFLREQQEIRKYVDKLNALCKTLNSGFSNSDERQASEYIKTLNHLKGKKDKYVEMYSDSIIDKDTMKEKVAIIDNQIHETEQIISRIQGPNLTIQNDIKEIKATIQFLEKEEANFKKNENHSMSREDIIKLIDMIVIDENGNPNIIFTMNAKYKEIFEKHARLYKDMVANE